MSNVKCTSHEDRNDRLTISSRRAQVFNAVHRYLIEAQREIRDLGRNAAGEVAETEEESLSGFLHTPRSVYTVAANYTLAIARLTIARRRRRGATAAMASETRTDCSMARVTMIMTGSISIGNSFALLLASRIVKNHATRGLALFRGIAKLSRLSRPSLSRIGWVGPAIKIIYRP